MALSSYKVAPDFVRLAFTQMCILANTKVAQCLRREEDLRISSFSIDPSDYSCADAFRVDYLLSSYLSKYTGLVTGIDTKAKALSNFEIAEQTCKATNERLRKCCPVLVDPILHRAQRLIANLLGEFSLERLQGEERWGPGSTYEFTRKQAYLDTKISEFPITVTLSCLNSLTRVIVDDLHWSEIILGVVPSGDFSLTRDCFAIVDGSRITTVPKNAKTDRTIAVEPRGNMFLQKAVGRKIRTLLKRVGVDLDDQSLNQRLAARAVSLELATIDLSMASDTISSSLIWELLPFEWAEYLDKIRSKRYTLDGEKFSVFQKFSSMGNGFTFELESLIFWALTRAVHESNPLYDQECNKDPVCAVYGDDIILPSRDAHVLTCVFSYLGFTINAEKSFSEGLFRESCGRHYFDGQDVTPIYQKEVVEGVNSLSHIRFLNRLSRYAVKHNDGTALDPVMGKVWLTLYRYVKYGRHPFIPFGTEGDDGYCVGHQNMSPTVKYDRNYGFRLQTVTQVRGAIPAHEQALYAYALRQGSDSRDTYGIAWSHDQAALFKKRFAQKNSSVPFNGDIESRDDEESVRLRWKSDRWVEPSWEFYLDVSREAEYTDEGTLSPLN